MSLFRNTYRELSIDEAKLVSDVKSKADELHALVANLPSSRYLSLGVTALEQAVMWLVKHVTG